MKSAIRIIFILFFAATLSYAQKYSLLTADFIVPKDQAFDQLRLTYMLREELLNYDIFSILNRNVTSQFIRYMGEGSGTSYTQKKSDIVDHITDVLLRKDLDFGIVAEIKPQADKYLLTVSLLNYEGTIVEDEITVDKGEEEIKKALKTSLTRILTQIHLAPNEIENPFEYNEMVLVPGGNAIIGSFSGEPDEAPQRTVFVPVFYIDKYEVSNALYKKFVESTKRTPPVNTINSEYTIWKDGTYPAELAHHPVVNVTWFDAKAYCEWAGERLPTAIEWEKAARGPYGNIYPWGNEFFPGYANLYSKGLSYVNQSTVLVGTYSKSKSYYDVHDLAGNVWEWTASSGKNPGDLRKSAKGGGWGYNGNKNSARASNSIYFTPDYTSNCLGFRCAK
jgi:formylglycine-generating enzyme required for sulfatase activity